MGNNTVLITGSTGLLGKCVTDSLCLDHDVHAIVRDPLHAIDSRVTPHVIDFSSDWSSDSLPDQVDVVIHLAQSEFFREFPERALDVFRVNVESTARLIDYARRAGARHFVYASSGGIYGFGQQAFDENAPIIGRGDLGFYLGSKLSGETLVQHYANLMQITILRFFFIYGKEQKRSMLLPRLVDNVKDGNPVVLQGEQGIRINPIHVSDASNAVVATLGLEESSIFNVAGPEVLSLFQICQTIGGRLGTEVNYTREEIEPRDLVGDISAMRGKLVEPSICFADGMDDLLS